MPLHLYLSNRLEELAAQLGEVVAQPPASPFAAETIVVQSKGMQRWLAMTLARRFGVWGNCDYPFPNALAQRLLRSAGLELTADPSFAPELLTWKIMARLPDLLGRNVFAPLEHYLQGGADALKTFQLASRIADTYDQYTLYRPELLLGWEAGEGDDWQAALWRELVRDGSGPHRARLRETFCRRAQEGGLVPGNFPKRISLFGISCLPKYHLDLLAAAAGVTEVHLFLLSPSREYWGDIVPARELARRSADERPYLSEGNPLLASLGRLGRDFFELMVEVSQSAPEIRELYRDPGRGSLLASLQSDILNLRGRSEERRPFDPADSSVQVHSCHGPMREVEVLHDRLLDLFETRPGLQPRDVVVMTPDIEAYAPYISAVFAGSDDPARQIPFSIADRSLACEGEVASAFLRLLDLPAGRFGVTHVLDILASPPVRRRFELDEREFDTIRRWLEELRVRWGIDEADRQRHGLPPYRENSWRAGLERLLLGYAMPAEEDRLFAGILPYDEIEGEGGITLGKFVAFIERLIAWGEVLLCPATLEKWQQRLQQGLDDFFAADDDTLPERMALAEAVADFGELQESAGYRSALPLAVVRTWLQERLAGQQRDFGFMSGGVTFCAMLPMRSIPFRVVALIGMNDGAFPRQDRPPAFDLMAAHPRRGDRSLRDEDRYLFLEALLSARDAFYLSYVGQSLRDSSERPPSVLVSEFLDAVAAAVASRDEKGRELLVIRHPLQPFSPAYFDGSTPLFSYSGENCRAIGQRREESPPPAPFITTPLPEGNDGVVELASLLSFYDHPARYFLRHRLGVRLEPAAPPLEEREPFVVDHLDAYRLRLEFVERRLRGEDGADVFNSCRARGVLPPARHGEAVFAGLWEEAAGLAGRVAQLTGGASPLDPLEVDVECGPWRLVGRLDRIWPAALVRYRPVRSSGKDQLRLWIEHLALNAAVPEGYPRQSRLEMKDAAFRFEAVEGAAELLRPVLEYYRQGLTRPLRYFPASSFKYAEGSWDPGKALSGWVSSDFSRGEEDDPWFQLCFGREEPFAGEFDAVARTLLDPLLQHRKKG